MLTRLKIDGFKNLVNVDIRLGPFTCVAGPNGVGKSNLFDAIHFLSKLADETLMEAALGVRDDERSTTTIRSLFHRFGETISNEMSFVAEMIIPKSGIDDLGQTAKATITALRYSLRLKYTHDDGGPSLGKLELVHEKLDYLKLGDAKRNLKFPNKPNWLKSVLVGKKTSPFISTENGSRVVTLRQDQRHGRPKSFLAETLPRTVLSAVNAAESPTAFLARQEMRSWRILQLEPSALRKPDPYTTTPGIGSDGAHLPATIEALARSTHSTNGRGENWVYDQIATALAELIDDVESVSVDHDDKRELLTVRVTDKFGTEHPAHALSDGTLRFLALVVLQLDPNAMGLICMEEPENGIHPKRIQAIMRLLQGIAMDTDEADAPDNPLRQVIVNTHSPAVVMETPEDSLLVAEARGSLQNGQHRKSVHFSWLEGTWRQEAEPETHSLALGRLLAYLGGGLAWSEVSNVPVSEDDSKRIHPPSKPKARRVIDRSDVQMLLPFKEFE